MSNIRVDITPDKSLIQKIGLVGYRTEQAVAELLDNSIDARISDEKEGIRVRLDFEAKRIHVEDDGQGMSKKDLANAMTIAKGTKTRQNLGRFGIGMKSACSALGKKFTVTTSKAGSYREYRAEYDEKDWLSDKSKNWRNFIITEKILDRKNGWHGTKITVSELSVPLYANQVSKFKENFGIRYSPYLQSGQISIQVNTVHCRPVKPPIVEKSRRGVRVKLPFGREIHGYVALLKKRSIKGNYGIHLFRNGRLIKSFAKFGFSAHPENSMIMGELNLDHVPVNFSKSEFIEESPEYQNALNAFKTSEGFVQTLHSSRTKGADVASIESVLGYFDGASPARHLEPSIRTKISRELLENAASFMMKGGKNPIKVDIKMLKNEPLYTIQKKKSCLKVTINGNDDAFKFVKNPLFMIGMIASEVKLLDKRPEFEELLERRNREMRDFLREWAKNPKPAAYREREAKMPNFRNYRLADELIDMHEFLKENIDFRFQFTALSTLAPYLHNLRGKLVYTLHTAPNRGEHIADLLSEEFGGAFAIVDRPDHGSLGTLLKMRTVDRIVAIREYRTIKGTTIATPEKAFLDLMVEKYTYNIPLDDTDLKRMLQSMENYNLINHNELERYGKVVKKSVRLENIIEMTR